MLKTKAHLNQLQYIKPIYLRRDALEKQFPIRLKNSDWFSLEILRSNSGNIHIICVVHFQGMRTIRQKCGNWLFADMAVACSK